MSNFFDKYGLDLQQNLCEHLLERTKKFFNRCEPVTELEYSIIETEYRDGFIPFTEGGVYVDTLLYFNSETLSFLKSLNISPVIMDYLEKDFLEEQENTIEEFIEIYKAEYPDIFKDITPENFYERFIENPKNNKTISTLIETFYEYENEKEIDNCYRVRSCVQKNEDEDVILFYIDINTEAPYYRSNADLKREIGSVESPVEFLLVQKEIPVIQITDENCEEVDAIMEKKILEGVTKMFEDILVKPECQNEPQP